MSEPGASGPDAPATPAEGARPSWSDRVAELGRAGFVIHMTVQALTITGLYLALTDPSWRATPWVAERLPAGGSVGAGGALFSAWILSKALFVPRAALTCVLAPALMRPIDAAWSRLRG